MNCRVSVSALVGVVARGAWPLVIALAPGPAVAQQAWDVDRGAVDAVFAAYDRSNTPGCAVGVVRDGALEYGRGYGMANLEHGIAITPQTVFRTGSVGKQFTAAAVAIAALDGHLSLDEPARRWIPELPAYPRDPTIRQLVHHTSGLRDYLTLMSLRGLRDDDFYTTPDVRALIARQTELNFEPGSEFLYSNSGYFLLGEIVREATGRSLRAYAEETLFGPLGMTHTHFHDDHTHIVPNRAAGYAPADGGFRISQTTLDMVGDGGVFTSVEDLVRWIEALNSDGLRPGLNEVLESTVPLTGGEDNPYAFGQRLSVYRGLRTISHGGSFVGFRAAIARFPDQGVGIATLCNRSDADPSTLSLRVADVVLADVLDAVVEVQSGNAARPEAPGSRTMERAGDPEAFLGTFYSPELDAEYVFYADQERGVLRLRFGPDFDRSVEMLGTDHLRAGELELRTIREGGRVVAFDVDAGRVQNLRFTRR